MRRVPALALALGLSVTLGVAGCTQPPPVQPTPSVSTPAPDLTLPGQARSMVRRLIAKAGTSQLIQVEVTATTASITVVKANQPETWAWRDGEIKQVDSDVAYVQQEMFSIDNFNINDVGALFRLAAERAGSQQDQELQIVDSSAGEVLMTVTTLPESKTVFFKPDGTLVPILDFHDPDDITIAVTDVIGSRTSASAVSVDSAMGAWLDFPGGTTTTIRRLRTSTVPVTINERSQRPSLPQFPVSDVHPAAIWSVLESARARNQFATDTHWAVVIDDRAGAGRPRMYFTIGNVALVTDTEGVVIG